MYDGIDLVYYGNQRRLEFYFEASPEADPRTIQLGYEGMESPGIDTNGDHAKLYADLSIQLDAFIAQLDPSGSFLLYSTYLGGKGPDEGRAIAADPAGNIYVTGDTASLDFPASRLFPPGSFHTLFFPEKGEALIIRSVANVNQPLRGICGTLSSRARSGYLKGLDRPLARGGVR